MTSARILLILSAVTMSAPAWAVHPFARPSTLGAQEPPDLVPTDADRAIYGLAVDSTVYPDEATVLLLQERTLRVEEDGTFTRGLRQVRQVLRESAVDALAELAFAYDPSREAFSLERAAVVEADGTVVGASPVHVQELDQPVSRSAPVYTAVKRVRATLGDLTVGRIVDWRYTIETTDPPIPGDVLHDWNANSATPILRSRFVLDTPVAWKPRISQENLDGPTELREEGGRVIRVWAYEHRAPIEPEP
ncbi:MAG TPA: DUF3857 domain-containing protein, partial [Longimicrobiales bacterium]|nr:DUF3857 domain-containing protein [Longimicrobiales bacterium]